MQQPPIPVDVTSTWWDYVVDVADILAGLGTAGALIVAAIAYRRQEEDKRRQQASRILVGLSHMQPRDKKGRIPYYVSNRSDLPVYDVMIQSDSYELLEWSGDEKGMVIFGILRPGEEHTIVSSGEALLIVTFQDSSGRHWQRLSNGKIFPIRRAFRRTQTDT